MCIYMLEIHNYMYLHVCMFLFTHLPSPHLPILHLPYGTLKSRASYIPYGTLKSRARNHEYIISTTLMKSRAQFIMQVEVVILYTEVARL